MRPSIIIPEVGLNINRTRLLDDRHLQRSIAAAVASRSQHAQIEGEKIGRLKLWTEADPTDSGRSAMACFSPFSSKITPASDPR